MAATRLVDWVDVIDETTPSRERVRAPRRHRDPEFRKEDAYKPSSVQLDRAVGAVLASGAGDAFGSQSRTAAIAALYGVRYRGETFFREVFEVLACPMDKLDAPTN